MTETASRPQPARRGGLAYLTAVLDELRAKGTYFKLRVLDDQQAPVCHYDGREVINLASNNYLGLANDPRLIEAAVEATRRFGVGSGAVRTIAGTMRIHMELEEKIARFKNVEACVVFQSGFAANAGTVSAILGKDDFILSDELNHASIIDGIRLSKAARFRYRNGDMADLEAQLQQAGSARHRLIVTDGVFSMDGFVARLDRICDLAEKYHALVMVDDSHAVGFFGPGGRGTPALFGVEQRVDILTGTLGKALGGASGGYISGRQAIIDLLRQRSRPYLFSNSVAPPIVAATLAALDLVSQSAALLDTLRDNTAWFRQSMTAAGFTLQPGDHPIVPILLGDAALATRVAERMLAKGVYVVAFSYPVVPMGKARIRTQISAAHSRADLEFALRCFIETKAELGI